MAVSAGGVAIVPEVAELGELDPVVWARAGDASAITLAAIRRAFINLTPYG
jgi:hypothetical protein